LEANGELTEEREMSDSVVIAREAVRESLVRKALAAYATLKEDVRKGCKLMVEAMADMNDTEREQVVRKVMCDGWKPDWIRRMAACAKRGLVDAEHLYGPIRRLTDVAIVTASRAALEQMADPAAEFALVEDNGKTVMVRADSVNANMVSRVWDRAKGSISPKEQRKRLSKRLRGELSGGPGGVWTVASAIPRRDEAGRELMEIRWKLEGESGMDEEVRIVSVRELRRLLK